MLPKDVKILYFYSVNRLWSFMSAPYMFVLFIFSKTVRLTLFILLLVSLFHGLSNLSGFTRDQMIFFFLCFNMIDTAAQFLFREVYYFRPLLISGGLDQILIKPFNPLVRVLLGGPDFIDCAMLIIMTVITVWFTASRFHPAPLQWLLYFALLVNGILLAAGFHIFVLGLGIRVIGVDHLVMIYRDLTALMRIPVDLYIEPIRFIITYLLPMGIMFTFPAKALLGLLSLSNILISFSFAFLLLYLALIYWHRSLRHYSSASS